MLIRDGEVGRSGNFIFNTYSLHCHHQNDSALRWAVVWAILMFHVLCGQTWKFHPVLTLYRFSHLTGDGTLWLPGWSGHDGWCTMGLAHSVDRAPLTIRLASSPASVQLGHWLVTSHPSCSTGVAMMDGALWVLFTQPAGIRDDGWLLMFFLFKICTLKYVISEIIFKKKKKGKKSSHRIGNYVRYPISQSVSDELMIQSVG